MLFFQQINVVGFFQPHKYILGKQPSGRLFIWSGSESSANYMVFFTNKLENFTSFLYLLCHCQKQVQEVQTTLDYIIS